MTGSDKIRSIDRVAQPCQGKRFLGDKTMILALGGIALGASVLFYRFGLNREVIAIATLNGLLLTGWGVGKGLSVVRDRAKSFLAERSASVGRKDPGLSICPVKRELSELVADPAEDPGLSICPVKRELSELVANPAMGLERDLIDMAEVGGQHIKLPKVMTKDANRQIFRVRSPRGERVLSLPGDKSPEEVVQRCYEGLQREGVSVVPEEFAKVIRLCHQGLLAESILVFVQGVHFYSDWIYLEDEKGSDTSFTFIVEEDEIVGLEGSSAFRLWNGEHFKSGRNKVRVDLRQDQVESILELGRSGMVLKSNERSIEELLQDPNLGLEEFRKIELEGREVEIAEAFLGDVKRTLFRIEDVPLDQGVSSEGLYRSLKDRCPNLTPEQFCELARFCHQGLSSEAVALVQRNLGEEEDLCLEKYHIDFQFSGDSLSAIELKGVGSIGSRQGKSRQLVEANVKVKFSQVDQMYSYSSGFCSSEVRERAECESMTLA